MCPKGGRASARRRLKVVSFVYRCLYLIFIQKYAKIYKVQEDKYFRKGGLFMQKPLGMNFIKEHFEELASFVRKGINSEFRVRPVETTDGKMLQIFEDGDWSYNNSWLIGEPSSGEIVIRYKGSPCWSMSYRSEMMPYANRLEVYSCLRDAMAQPNDDGYFRGPSEFFSSGNLYTYRNSQNGDLAKFSGHEYVKDIDGDVVFKIRYNGGAIGVY